MIFRKYDFFRKGECPECGHREFEVGPSNGVVHNLKCKRCKTYFTVVQAKRYIEAVIPDRPW